MYSSKGYPYSARFSVIENPNMRDSRTFQIEVISLVNPYIGKCDYILSINHACQCGAADHPKDLHRQTLVFNLIYTKWNALYVEKI